MSMPVKEQQIEVGGKESKVRIGTVGPFEACVRKADFFTALLGKKRVANRDVAVRADEAPQEKVRKAVEKLTLHVNEAVVVDYLDLGKPKSATETLREARATHICVGDPLDEIMPKQYRLEWDLSDSAGKRSAIIRIKSADGELLFGEPESAQAPPTPS